MPAVFSTGQEFIFETAKLIKTTSISTMISALPLGLSML
jgi:hypothetical protein